MNMMTRSLLLSTAISLPLGGFASAQELVEINDEQLAEKSQECQDLGRTYNDVNDPTTVPKDAVIAAINDDVAEECTTLEERVTGNRVTDEETVDTEKSEEVSEKVDLSEDATIEGQAEVTVPEPDVDVQVPAPNVAVTTQQPRVNVTDTATDIQVNQKQPTITVEIPEIIVRIDNPAPDIYVLSSDPKVQVSAAEPDVQVEQGDPTVDVTQGDPQLNVNLGVDTDENGTNIENADSTTDTADVDGAQNVDGNTEVAEGDAQVDIMQAEGEAQVEVKQNDANVAYQSAEPNVSVMMAEQPTIEIQQGDEPNVIIETQQEREQRLAQQKAEQAQARPQDEDVVESGAELMTVGQLLDMNVMTADGENLGNPEAVVDVNGEPNLVLSSGGFLGLGGKQVPVPLTRVIQDGDALVVDSMTESEVDAAGDFEYDSELEMSDDEQVQLKQ